MDKEQLKVEYEEHGFVSCPDLLTEEEMAIIRDELDAIARDASKYKGVILEKDCKTLRSVSNPHLYNEVFDRLIHHPKLLEVVRYLLNDDVYVFQLGVNCKAPFNGDIWFWHQDFPTYHYDDHIPTPRMVNTLILVDEVTHHNAPLMLVPGSHKLSYPKPETSSKGTSYAIRYTDEHIVTEQVAARGLHTFTGKPGSITFMNTNVIHGSTANLSPWPRKLITLTYNAITNKATHPSDRDRSIVYDDRDLGPLQPLGEDCLTSLARRKSA
jgi:ectoine hydroxylase